MSPRVAKQDREEPPKPLVQMGTVGSMPLNGQTLSYLVQGYCNVLLGQKDALDTLYHKEHHILKVQQGKNTTTHDLAGSLLNGLSDAFYRGKLPEVLLVTAPLSGVDSFLEEFLEHLDKLGALGFFVPKQHAFETSLVNELIPCVVLASNGIFYQSFRKRLMERLAHMASVPTAIKQQIPEKITRGLFMSYEGTTYQRGASLLLEEPTQLRLAGGSMATQNTIKTVLTSRGFQVSIEEKGEFPAERIELQNALWRSLYHILPALNQRGEISHEEMKEDEGLLEATLLEIGKRRNVFEEKDSRSRLLAAAAAPSTEPALVSGDSSVFKYLVRYAEAYGYLQEMERFGELKQKVLQQLEVKRNRET